jgi:hypothetical protein
MASKQLDAATVMYLRRHPRKARKLINSAMKGSIAEIEEKHSEVITACETVNTVLDEIINEIVARKESCEDGGKAWGRFYYGFHEAFGSQYAAYRQEVAACKAKYGELQALLLGQRR